MWFERDTKESETEKVAMVQICRRDRRQSVEDDGGNGGTWKEISRKTITWRGTVQQDLKVLEIEEGLALDQAGWRRIITNLTPRMGEDRL